MRLYKTVIISCNIKEIFLQEYLTVFKNGAIDLLTSMSWYFSIREMRQKEASHYHASIKSNLRKYIHSNA